MKNKPGNVEQQGDCIYVTLAKGVRMEFVRIPAGEFWMGTEDGYSSEQPKHKVNLDEYWMGKYPVTVAQYAVYDKKKYKEAKANHPVVEVSWHDANKFTAWLSKLIDENAENRGIKILLPREAQWEKAARGTDSRTYPWGNQSPDMALCNFNDIVGGTKPVGQYSPKGDSPYGCVDMAGNVWEWVQDWFDGDYYKYSPSRNPTGPASGKSKVVRGGTWYHIEKYVQSTYRCTGPVNGLLNDIGFRCAISE